MCESCEINAAQTHSFLCEQCERYATIMLDGEDWMEPIPNPQEGIPTETQE